MAKNPKAEPRHSAGVYWPRHSKKSRTKYQLAAKKVGAWTAAFLLSGATSLLVYSPATSSGTPPPDPDCVASSTQVDRTVTLRINYDPSVAQCDWDVPTGVRSLAVAVVGGGGGGGGSQMDPFDEVLSGTIIGGGGGAGEVIYNPSLSVIPGTTYSIKVGAGGAGARAIFSDAATAPANGGESKFGDEATAKGGGAGGYLRTWSWTTYVGAAGGSGGGSIGTQNIDGVQYETNGARSESVTRTGWRSFGSPGEAAPIEVLRDENNQITGYRNRAGRGGGAMGITGDPARGVYLLDQCLATGGAGSVRKIFQDWRTIQLPLSPSDHHPETGCVDLSGNAVGAANSSIMNRPPAANSGSGGAFYRTAGSQDGISGASGTVIIRFNLPAPAVTPSSVALDPSSDTSTKGDGITANSSPDIKVVGASLGDTVTVTASKAGATNVQCQFVAEIGGSSLTLREKCRLNGLSNGVWEVRATATNTDGQTSSTITTNITIDSTAPVVTLSGPTSTSVRNNNFLISANETIICSTLDKPDFLSGHIRVTQITNGPDSKSCYVHTTSLIPPKTRLTGFLKEGSFSVSDQAGNSATSISSGSPAQIVLEITDESSGGLKPEDTSGTIPTQFQNIVVNSFFGALDSRTQAALSEKKIVAAPPEVPKTKLVSDLSHLSSSDTFTVNREVSITTGRAVGFDLDFSSDLVTNKDLATYLKVDGAWKFLGRSPVSASSVSQYLAITQPGTYEFTLLLVDKGATIVTASIPSPSLALEAFKPASGSSPEPTLNANALGVVVQPLSNISDSDVNSASEQKIVVVVTASGSQIPVSGSPTPAPTQSAAPAPSPTPSPTASPTPRPSSSPTPRPRASSTPTAAPSEPTPTPQPSATPTPSPTATTSPAPNPTPQESISAQAPSSSSPGILSGAATQLQDISQALSNLFQAPVIEVGAPVANPALGAIGDDSLPPQEFDAQASPETIAAIAETATKAVAIAASVAGVAAAAGAAAGAAGAASAAAGGAAAGGVGSTGGGAPSSSNSAGSSSSAYRPEGIDDFDQEDKDDGDITELEVRVDQLQFTKKGWGDKLAIFTLPFMKFFDRASNRFAIRLGPFSPLLSKVFSDGAYLRAMFGSLSLLPVIAAAYLGFLSAAATPGEILTPPWLLLLGIAILGVFDVMAGFAATVSYWATALVLLGSIPDLGDLRSLLAVSVIAIGPALLTTAFRNLRKEPSLSAQQWWERLSDLAIAPFMAGWTVSIMISVLPAVTGFTSAAANHVLDFGVAIAIAAAVRVILEEFVAHSFPKRLDRITPTQVSEPPIAQKAVALATKYLLWVLVSGALIGPGWQAWIGSALFLIPTIVKWFDDKFPNSPLLWKLIPSGIPGLAFSMLVAAATTSFVAKLVGENPDFGQWNFVLLPLPLLLISMLAMFGRHGKGPKDLRFSQQNTWIYRLGGIVMFVITLQLAGII